MQARMNTYILWSANLDEDDKFQHSKLWMLFLGINKDRSKFEVWLWLLLYLNWIPDVHFSFSVQCFSNTEWSRFLHLMTQLARRGLQFLPTMSCKFTVRGIHKAWLLLNFLGLQKSLPTPCIRQQGVSWCQGMKELENGF